jgi:hypothetical protein
MNLRLVLCVQDLHRELMVRSLLSSKTLSFCLGALLVPEAAARHGRWADVGAAASGRGVTSSARRLRKGQLCERDLPMRRSGLDERPVSPVRVPCQ